MRRKRLTACVKEGLLTVQAFRSQKHSKDPLINVSIFFHLPYLHCKVIGLSSAKKQITKLVRVMF